MDDPWGSPWTTGDAIQGEPPNETPSPRKDSNQTRDADFAAAVKPNSPARHFDNASPWGDGDDGFGGWESPTILDNKASNNVWADWTAPAPSPSPTKAKAEQRLAAVAVTSASTDDIEDGHQERSPSFRAQLAPAVLEQPLDPWASSNDVSALPDQASVTRPSYGAATSPAEVQEEVPSSTRSLSTSKKAATNTIEQEAEGGVRVGHEDDNNDTIRPAMRSSRAGSDATASTANSDREANRPDSPITSIEENAKHKIASRQPSGKVQVLVDMFDGMERAASVDPETPIRSSSTGRGTTAVALNGVHSEGETDDDDSDDFGELEEAVGEEQPTADIQPPPQARKPRPVPFTADLGLLSTLFEQIHDIPKASGSEIYIPDQLPADSFTEVSERKCWYRISRQGSARRHDTGDDEAYKRVAWVTSDVRQRTIKIVRRWMEEDSIGGKPVLGGGATRGGMFGWDSKSKTIALDEVYRRKTVAPVPRAAGVKLPPAPALSASVNPSSASGAAKPPTAAIAPNATVPKVLPLDFGWGGESLAPLPRATPAPTMSQRAAAKSGNRSRTDAGTQSAGSKPANPVVPLVTSSMPDEPSNFDEDDDWGEMVVSPTNATHDIPVVGSLGAIAAAPPPSNSSERPLTQVPTEVIAKLPQNPSIPAISGDLWDLSFFGDTSTAAPALTPVSLQPSSSPAIQKSQTFAIPAAATLPKPSADRKPKITRQPTTNSGPPPTTTSRSLPTALALSKSARLAPAGDIIDDIIQRLPDLSYMLR